MYSFDTALLQRIMLRRWMYNKTVWIQYPNDARTSRLAPMAPVDAMEDPERTLSAAMRTGTPENR